MNKVILIGRLTKDPELRYTAGQMAVATFTLAVDRIKKSEEKSADFLRVVTFGKTAENIERYQHKGALVGVEGSITSRSYEKDGATVYVTEIIADRVEFLGGAKEPTPAPANFDDLPF
jgi:single-strand DNA-binding protein